MPPSLTAPVVTSPRARAPRCPRNPRRSAARPPGRRTRRTPPPRRRPPPARPAAGVAGRARAPIPRSRPAASAGPSSRVSWLAPMVGPGPGRGAARRPAGQGGIGGPGQARRERSGERAAAGGPAGRAIAGAARPGRRAPGLMASPTWSRPGGPGPAACRALGRRGGRHGRRGTRGRARPGGARGRGHAVAAALAVLRRPAPGRPRHLADRRSRHCPRWTGARPGRPRASRRWHCPARSRRRSRPRPCPGRPGSAARPG